MCLEPYRKKQHQGHYHICYFKGGARTYYHTTEVATTFSDNLSRYN